MSKSWQLHEAKNKFTEVVEKALSAGPQMISRRGIDTVVVISIKDYKKLTRPEGTLVEFFAQSPLRGVKLDLERDRDTGRGLDLEVSA